MPSPAYGGAARCRPIRVWDSVLSCKVLLALSLLAFVVNRHRVMGTVIQMQMGACDHMDFVMRTLLEMPAGQDLGFVSICGLPRFKLFCRDFGSWKLLHLKEIPRALHANRCSERNRTRNVYRAICSRCCPSFSNGLNGELSRVYNVPRLSDSNLPQTWEG